MLDRTVVERMLYIGIFFRHRSVRISSGGSHRLQPGRISTDQGLPEDSNLYHSHMV